MHHANSTLEAAFTVARKDLLPIFRTLKKTSPKTLAGGLLKISVLPTAIDIKSVGANWKVAAETEGLADITVPAQAVYAYVTTVASPKYTFRFKEGVMVCNTTTYSSSAIKLETFLSSADSELPVNADDYTLLRCAHQKGREWMKEYGLALQHDSAELRMKTAIAKTANLLKDFRVSRVEIEALVLKRVEQEKAA